MSSRGAGRLCRSLQAPLSPQGEGCLPCPPPAPHTLGSSLHLFLCPTEDKAAARWVHPEGRGLRTEEAASAPSAPSLSSLFAPVSRKELPGQDPVALVCLQGSCVRGCGATKGGESGASLRPPPCHMGFIMSSRNWVSCLLLAQSSSNPRHLLRDGRREREVQGSPSPHRALPPRLTHVDKPTVGEPLRAGASCPGG